MTTKHLEDAIALHNNAAQPLAGIETLDATQRQDNPANHETTHRQRSRRPSTSASTIPPSSESKEVAPGVVLDYNEANQVVGVEMHWRSYSAAVAHPTKSRNAPPT